MTQVKNAVCRVKDNQNAFNVKKDIKLLTSACIVHLENLSF